MAILYSEKDAQLNLLKEKTIAVLGFGSQGHAHALNLHDSGVNVMVGLNPTSPRRPIVEKAGLPVRPIPEAVAKADMIMMLIPDEHHADVFQNQIRPSLSPGKMLLVAHGFSIHFHQVIPPPELDVAMIAPKGPGHLVRREFTEGRGVPALLAVHRDFSGNTRQLALAYAKGIGATRSGVMETTFREETETDLFGEQAILCGGVTSLMKAGFETLVQAGYQPEMAYFECINEMKLIVDLIYEGGFSRMRHSISNTAEYGDYITQNKLITDETRKNMKQILDDIQSGRFAKEWILENRAGQPSFLAMRKREREHPLEEVGKKIRSLMPWLKPSEDTDLP